MQAGFQAESTSTPCAPPRRLGGAYAALANDVTAGYWNPAGLSNMMYPQIILMHDERFGGLVNYDYGAAATPLGAAILAEFGAILATPPELKSVKAGYGSGPEVDQGKTSFIRVTLGEVE